MALVFMEDYKIERIILFFNIVKLTPDYYCFL